MACQGPAGMIVPRPDFLKDLAHTPTVKVPYQGWAMIWTLLGIFAGGMALNLTPCIYPLIPITVSYFGGQKRLKKPSETCCIHGDLLHRRACDSPTRCSV